MPSCVNPCEINRTPTRSTGYAYEDADGVYVTTTTDALGHTTRAWRHPGLGLVVETDDNNQMAATQTYDTFGRPLLTTQINGATTLIAYLDSAANGLSYTVSPESKATRQVFIQTDSWGRTTSETSPIDATHTLTASSAYDAFGRLMDKGLHSGGKFINDYGYSYDDLGRMVSLCHLSTDGAQHCKTNSYDGLSTTLTDESGNVTVETADTMGRMVTHHVAGVPDATWTYGPFSQIQHENTADATGEADFVYDVRGRRIRTTRIGAGIRDI